MAQDPYIVRRESLAAAFPPGHEPPRLLLDFADWLDGRPWGSLSCFRLQGTLSDEAPIVDGSALRREFSLFLYLPDGSLVGLWHPDGVPRVASPVVGLGSEGDAAVLAGSLEGFLAKLARDAFSESAWSDLAAYEDDDEKDEAEIAGDDAHSALAAWLGDRIGAARLDELAGEACDQTAFAARMDSWIHEREAHWAGHPILAEIGRALSAHRPRGKSPWDRTRLRATIVGALCEVQVYRSGPQPGRRGGRRRAAPARAPRRAAPSRPRSRPVVRGAAGARCAGPYPAPLRVSGPPGHRRRAGPGRGGAIRPFTGAAPGAVDSGLALRRGWVRPGPFRADARRRASASAPPPRIRGRAARPVGPRPASFRGTA